MDITPLTDEHRTLYLCCLEDWSDEAREAGPRRECWYDRMKDCGLRVLLARDDAGVVGGMIQYIPIEHSFADGDGLYFVCCIWVHGYKEGRGNFQKRGMGKALLAAAEDDARELGAKGLAAWGISMPFWMRASWFRKQGYVNADKMNGAVLLWKPFTDDATPPRWIRRKKTPQPKPGRVTVTAFTHGWCIGQNLAYERAKRAAAEFGDDVVFEEVDTMDRSTLHEWGIADAIFIDGKELRNGPPPSYRKIYKRIAARVRKL
jgi:GNAT superfamily N-acetyltransferase